jgi:hypothetical protein
MKGTTGAPSKKNNLQKAPALSKNLMLSIINLPSNFATTTISYVGEIFNDLSPLLTLIIGVLLGMVVVEIILGIFRK